MTQIALQSIHEMQMVRLVFTMLRNMVGDCACAKLHSFNLNFSIATHEHLYLCPCKWLPPDSVYAELCCRTANFATITTTTTLDIVHGGVSQICTNGWGTIICLFAPEMFELVAKSMFPKLLLLFLSASFSSLL